MAINTSRTYSTPNVALAAYLFSQGFEYIGIDSSDTANVRFQFTNSSKAMSSAISDWQIGRAEGNIVQFYLAYKRLLREVKS